GYHMGPVADAPGSAARRGGILDVFSPGQAEPARLDLWGDYVDSVRLFDPASQRSGERVDHVTVLPASEVLPAFVDRDAVDRLVRGLDFSQVRTAERDRMDEDLAELMAGLSLDNASLYAGFVLHHTLLDHL